MTIPDMFLEKDGEKDGDGHFWTVDSEYPSAKVECWWSRVEKKFQGKTIAAEHFIIRQENHKEKRADLILLTQGQLYDLIKCLNKAVMET